MLKVLVVVVAFAVVVYFVTRAMQNRGQGPSRAHPAGGGRRPRPGSGMFPNLGSKEPPRPSAPDDDEDFLRDLDRKRLDPPEES